MLVYRYSGQEPVTMTFARFFGILSRVGKLRKLESGKPMTPTEIHEEMKAAREEGAGLI
jgi:hypothetical protein